jgi:hypothetical protein
MVRPLRLASRFPCKEYAAALARGFRRALIEGHQRSGRGEFQPRLSLRSAEIELRINDRRTKVHDGTLSMHCRIQDFVLGRFRRVKLGDNAAGARDQDAIGDR